MPELNQLSDDELDLSYAIGFVQEWNDKAPEQVKENFKLVTDGVTLYRTKYLAAQQDVIDLRSKYNDLTALTANYLATIQQLREQVDGLLIETQREYHKTDPE